MACRDFADELHPDRAGHGRDLRGGDAEDHRGLEAATFSSPPAKVRTLATVTATHGMAPVEVDIRGARLIGVEVLTEPPMPTPPSPSDLATNVCWASWQASVVPPSQQP